MVELELRLGGQRRRSAVLTSLQIGFYSPACLLAETSVIAAVARPVVPVGESRDRRPGEDHERERDETGESGPEEESPEAFGLSQPDAFGVARAGENHHRDDRRVEEDQRLRDESADAETDERSLEVANHHDPEEHDVEQLAPAQWTRRNDRERMAQMPDHEYDRRDPIETAGSILRGRMDCFGSHDHCMFVQPRDYESLGSPPYLDHVAAQVFFLERTSPAGFASDFCSSTVRDFSGASGATGLP